jgi:hypothetical protein
VVVTTYLVPHHEVFVEIVELRVSLLHVTPGEIGGGGGGKREGDILQKLLIYL